MMAGADDRFLTFWPITLRIVTWLAGSRWLVRFVKQHDGRILDQQCG